MEATTVEKVKALVAFGEQGRAMMASRILSLCALAGVVALGAYVAYSPSWQGAVCDGILALCFWASVNVESKRAKEG